MADFPTRAARALGRWDRFRGGVLCAGIVVSALAYSFGLTSFLHAKEAVLAACLCITALTAALGSALTNARNAPLFGGACRCASWTVFAPLWLFLALSATIHLVVVPAAVPALVLTKCARIALVLSLAGYAVDLLADVAWRRRLLLAVAWSGVLVSLAGLVQYFGGAPGLFPRFEGNTQRVYSVFGNQDLFGGYPAVALPILLHGFLRRSRERALSVIGLCILLPGLLISGSRSAWLAAFVGAVLSLPWRPDRRRVHATGPGRWFYAGAGLLLVSVMAGTVFWARDLTIDRLAQTFGPQDQGTHLRAWFWDGTARMIRANPAVGVGPGNFAYWSPSFLGEALWASRGERYTHNELHTRHAHSDPLEVLAETGLVGGFCWLWFLVRLARRRGPEWAGLAALLVFSFFNFPLHSAPHLLAGLLLAGALLARPVRGKARRRQEAQTLQRPFGAGVRASLSILLAVFCVWAVVVPSFLQRRAEECHVAGEPSLDAYRVAVGHPLATAEAYKGYGIALFEAGRLIEARGMFQSALQGADTGDLYLVLGALECALGERGAAVEQLEECVKRWPSNSDAWVLLWRAGDDSDRAALEPRARRWVRGEVLTRLLEEEARQSSNGNTPSTESEADVFGGPLTTNS